MGRFSTKKKGAPSRSGVKRIEENLERNKITFDALFRFFERLGTTFDLKRIVRLFLMTLAGQLGLKRVSLYLLIPGEKRLEAYHSLGVRQKAAFPRIEADSMFLRWLREVTVPVHIDDFFTSRGGAADNEMELMSCIVNEGFAYVFPIDDGEELLGAIFFSGKVTGESFADFDKELLRMLVRVAAIAIKNAWLYQAVVLSKMELEKFSSVKKEFINHTSHELRTPLTVLKSALWSIESDEIGEDILMSMSKDAVLRLESKVEQLLSLNDIELNENIFGLEPEDISSLLEDCLKEVIPEIEEKQISVMVDDRARYREVMVDAPKIKIVLRSIIDNAVNSVERGGNITVTISISDCAPDAKQGIEIGDWNIARGESCPSGLDTGTLRRFSEAGRLDKARCFQKSADSSYLIIRIEDDGIGIPAEEIKTLSEPFRRASNSTLKNVKGLGLGLSVSQKIVAGHGGRIFCRSAEGEGAEFSIWLPLKQ